MPSPNIEHVPSDAFSGNISNINKMCQVEEHDRAFMQTKRNIYDAYSTNIPSKLSKC